MFKTAGFGDEIYQAMEKQLVSNQLENNYGFNRLAQAAECLHNAAEIFDQAGMLDVADEISQTIESLANEPLIDGGRRHLSSARTKGDTEERMHKHVEQVKNRLASLSGDDKWLGVDSKWLLPEMKFLGDPEKEAHEMHAFKQLSPAHFPGAK